LTVATITWLTVTDICVTNDHVYSQTCPCGHLFYCLVIDNFIWIELLLRGHLYYKDTLSFPKGDLLIQVWLYSICRTHNLDLSSFMTYHRDCNKSNMTWGSFARSLHFCVIFCRSLFVPLSLFFLSLAVLLLDLRIMITPLVSSNLTCNPPNIQMKGIYKTQHRKPH
jgi:hypothetical protein